EFRRIEGNPEGRVLGQEHHVVPDHVALDGTVLRPVQEKVLEGPGINPPAEHALYARRPSAFDEEGREPFARQGQRGRGTRGSRSDDDGIKTLHGLPLPVSEKRDGDKSFFDRIGLKEWPEFDVASSGA